MSEWVETTIGGCVEVNTNTYKLSEKWQFINYLDTGNITQNSIDDIVNLIPPEDKIPSRARRKVQAGDIIYSTVRPIQRHYGLMANPPENFLVSTGFSVIRAKEGIADTRFIFWYLTQDHVVELLQTVGEHSTSTYPAIKSTDIENLTISLPPLDEQISIAELFSSLDNKIELNRQMNEVLEGMAQAVFKDWFVDFGPVGRKQEGEKDPVKILGGLIKDKQKAKKTATLFPDSFGDNGLPLGWEEGTYSQQIKIIGGGTPKTSVEEYWDGLIPWFSVRDTPNGSDCFVFETEKTITDKGLANSSAKMIDRGATIISARGTVGNLAIAGENMTFNQSCYALRPIDDKCICFVFLSAQHVVGQLKKKAHGSVFSTITRATFDSVLFPTIPDDVRDAFEGVVSPLFEKIRTSVKENQTLAETRDYLLPKLMSGAVRVGDVVDAVQSENSNVIPFNTDLLGRKVLPADKSVERDAVMVAAIIRAFDSAGFVVGNFRYQKAMYFMRRRLEHSLATTTRQAAGPYDGALKYTGGHALAKRRKYIREAIINGRTGNKPASKISEIDSLITQYGLQEALAWVVDKFKYKSNDEFECLATVDFAMNELRTHGATINVIAIQNDIARDPAWKPKLTKPHFTAAKIRSAIAELETLFGGSA